MEMQGTLKGYLESVEYRVGNNRGVGEAGLTLLGNIDAYIMNKNKNMFANLPEIFQESSFSTEAISEESSTLMQV